MAHMEGRGSRVPGYTCLPSGMKSMLESKIVCLIRQIGQCSHSAHFVSCTRNVFDEGEISWHDR